MFHKEAEHRGATWSTLQPEQYWSLVLACLEMREEEENDKSAPPSGEIHLKRKKKFLKLILKARNATKKKKK